MSSQKITIFTTCRPFEREFMAIQCNAIGSWMLLSPEPEIILIGDESGVGDIAKAMRLKHIPSVTRNRWGTPLLSSLWWIALTCGQGDTLAYVNSDIIFLDDFMPAVEAAQSSFSTFLMAGPRWDLTVNEPLEFRIDWQAKMRNMLMRKGERHSPTGVDWFAFTRDTFVPRSFPPLAIGRTGWDSWLIWKAMAKHHPVIDATMAVTAIHQRHSKGGKGAETKMNQAIAWQDREGKGYLWETNKRAVRAGRKIIIKEAPQPIDHWKKDVGWTDWK